MNLKMNRKLIWTLVSFYLLSLFGSIVMSEALKIQNPADDLPKKLNHPKSIEALQVGYLNLDTIVAKLYEPDNFFGNMELINGFLESERKSPTLLRGVKNLNDTIGLFLSLADHYNFCDYDSYKSLVQNYQAVEGRSHDLYEKRRPIEMMIYDYALEHARECGPKYVEIFEDISKRPATKVVAQIVDEVLKYLDADSLLAGENGSNTEHYEPEEVIETSLSRMDLTNYAFHTIVKNIENLVQGKSESRNFYPELNRKGKPALPKKFETDIFDKYLIIPCQQYGEIFRNIFAPARFDSMIRDNDALEPIFPTGSEEFNQAWIQYRTCTHLVHWADRKDILSVIEQVAKSRTKQH